jgi:VWFA-related protein
MPGAAANRVTVDQLQQVLTAAKTKPDADLAKQLSSLELTERLSSDSFEQLSGNLPGDKSRQALLSLADAAAFLDPPPAEIPSRPTPDFAQQRRMLALTVAYVSKTIPQLPNFFATQQITRFEDTPQLQKGYFFVPYEPLHRVGDSNATVLYRDGQEVIDSGSSRKRPTMVEGLATKGVFGPILATVLLDAAQSKLAWSHWEQGKSDVQAVFSYAVPKEKSHYEVSYCCVASEAATVVANMHPYRKVVGFHGDMAIDPATGTILRLRVEADLNTTDPVVKAGILVEYGRVEIGGKTYICPLKSVSIARAQIVQLDPDYKFPLANQLQPLKQSLNHVEFGQYHLFRADTQVLADGAAVDARAQPSDGDLNASAPVSAGASSVPSTPAETAAAASAGSSPAKSSDASALAKGPGPAAVSVAVAPSEAPVPEITVGLASNIPDAPLKPQLPALESGLTLRTTARLVDVSVVALDKKGHPVTGLKREDFEIDDNGRKQDLHYFVQAAQTGALASAQQPAPAAEQPVFTNRPMAATTGQPVPGPNESRSTILLVDAANVAWGDLSYARQEMLRFLKNLPSREPVALYILKRYGFQVLTEPTGDHALVADKLGRWMPSAQDLSNAQDEEERNRQHFDWVHSGEDLLSVNGNGNKDPEGMSPGAARAGTPTDPKLQTFGSNPERDTLYQLTSVAGHLAAVPGHKSLVWVSSDNVLADWSNQEVARQDKGSKFIDPIALRAQESLNNAHTSIYPLDASQLEAGGITADLGNRNVLAMGKTDRDNSLKKLGDADNGASPGRDIAQGQQDTHPIQGAFRDLADATGGRALRRASDIAGELDGIVNDGRAAYLLSFTPDQPPDNKYHLLTVKAVGRRDLTLRYRTGYEYDKEPASLKDRFRQAISQPADGGDIGLTVNPSITTNGTALKLNIAASDLGLAQQDELWTGKLDVFLVQRDDEGVHVQVSGQTLGLRLKPATYQRLLSDGIPFEVNVQPQAGAGSVRIVVVDENSGRMGWVTLPAAGLEAKR